MTALVEADAAFFWRLGTLSMLACDFEDVNALQVRSMHEA